MKTVEKKENAKSDNVDLSLFKELGLEEPILRSLKMQKFEKPTSIQEKTIPLALAGGDIMAGSATGSGKTLVFGAGIIQNSKRGDGIQALILAPTRELAMQVAQSLRIFSRYQPLSVATVYGGVSINPQIKELKKADVVVGTPGRILDHVNRRTIRFDKLKTLVLDEADTMLDMGFITDVEKIIKKCPENRQTLLFSATLTSEINGLAKKHTKEAARIIANSFVDPRKLAQITYNVSGGLKFSLLVHLLRHEDAELVMVFCNTRRNTDLVANDLISLGVEAKAIHGGLTQDKRSRIIKHFHSQKVHVLVCTDVAARGLDIKGVSHVYNYDLPTEKKQYLHRIGRTARAGKEGKAINILTRRDQEKFSRLLKDGSIVIAKAKTPIVEKVKNSRPSYKNPSPVKPENKKRLISPKRKQPSTAIEPFNRKENSRRTVAANESCPKSPRNNRRGGFGNKRRSGSAGKRVGGRRKQY
jgi:ATP-dependent RNA helicase DeaD